MAQANILDGFKGRLKSGGVRSNQFEVHLNFPTFVGQRTQASADGLFLCNSATLPKQTVGVTPMKFRGRELQLAGDSRTFEAWSVTVINDDFLIYQAFEAWQEGINSMESNDQLFIRPDEYKAIIDVRQLDRSGNAIKTFSLHGAFPNDISAVDLGFETDDTIQEFDIAFVYDYFTTTSDTAEVVDAGSHGGA